MRQHESQQTNEIDYNLIAIVIAKLKRTDFLHEWEV